MTSSSITGLAAKLSPPPPSADPAVLTVAQVEQLVAGRDTVQGTRQIFFAQMGGFDTHANELPTRVRVELDAKLMDGRSEKFVTEARIAITRPLDF